MLFNEQRIFIFSFILIIITHISDVKIIVYYVITYKLIMFQALAVLYITVCYCNAVYVQSIEKLVFIDKYIIHLLEDHPPGSGDALLDNILWYKQQLKKIEEGLLHHDDRVGSVARDLYKLNGPMFVKVDIDNEAVCKAFGWSRFHLHHIYMLIERIKEMWENCQKDYEEIIRIYEV